MQSQDAQKEGKKIYDFGKHVIFRNVIVWGRLYEPIGDGSLQAIERCFKVVVREDCDSTLGAIKDKYKLALGDVNELSLRAYLIAPAGQANRPKDVLIDQLASVGEALESDDHIEPGSFLAVVRPSEL